MADKTNAALIADVRSIDNDWVLDNSPDDSVEVIRELADALEAADQRVAEYAAVVEKAEDFVTRHYLDTRFGDEVLPILASAPDDALRELKADVWDEGEEASMKNQANWDGWRDTKPPITNPYREEQS